MTEPWARWECTQLMNPQDMTSNPRNFSHGGLGRLQEDCTDFKGGIIMALWYCLSRWTKWRWLGSDVHLYLTELGNGY